MPVISRYSNIIKSSLKKTENRTPAKKGEPVQALPQIKTIKSKCVILRARQAYQNGKAVWAG